MFDTLRDLARVVRSKNAGPFEITFDVLFAEADTYERVRRSGVLAAEEVARRLGYPADAVVWSGFVDPALGWKLTVRRDRPQGAPGERDTYGAQQHAPLLDIEVPGA